MASLVDQMVKNLPAMWETQVWSLDQEDPLEKGMATHYSILTWKTPWTEEPGGLQSMGLYRVGHDWATDAFFLQKGTKWLCKSVPRTDHSEPIQRNCLEIGNILLSCSIVAALLTLGLGHDYLPLEYPIPPHLSLNPDVSDPKVFVSFITSCLKPSLEEGEVSFFWMTIQDASSWIT